MSCFAGLCESSEEKDAKAQNKAINKKLKEEKSRIENELRLLLLGAGESGKSTIVKQMRIIHSKGFNEVEREQLKKPIFGNVVNSIQAILDFMDTAKISLADPSLAEGAEWIREYVREDDASTFENSEFFQWTKRLWADPGVQQAYRRSNEYQLNDSTKYFFDALDRISADDYLPTVQDVLQARVVTTGIFETQFIVEGVTFHMYDVGGQRSERRKWIQCFADVTGIIFTVATSAYNQTLREDNTQNRLVEALELFTSIWRNRWLSRVSVVLFLNKCDILAEKIKNDDMHIYFTDYTGGTDLDKAKRYIKNRFETIAVPSEHKRLYPHFTIATDTENIKRVFDDVKDIILHFHLAEFGLV